MVLLIYRYYVTIVMVFRELSGCDGANGFKTWKYPGTVPPRTRQTNGSLFIFRPQRRPPEVSILMGQPQETRHLVVADQQFCRPPVVDSLRCWHNQLFVYLGNGGRI
jgi:5-keto 4-deoxyuronate isomerase